MDNGAITGSVGTIIHPDESTSLRINLSTGFRSPNVDDSGKVFDSEPGFVIVPNPDLDAEYAFNAEVGLARIFGNNVRLDVTGYYTKLDNALVRRDFTLNGMDSILYDGELSRVQAIQNAAVATVYGVQAGLEFKLASGFGLTTQLNYQKGEEELDDGTTSPSRHAAPLFGSAGLSFTQRKLQLLFYAQYSGKKEFEDLPLEEQAKGEIYAEDANGNPYSPSWYTLNFKANFQLERNIFIGAGLENITDRRYRSYSSGMVAPGRNMIVSIRFDY
jgi:hemoglobin/transferrin/lactoferrin receptor protein